METSERALMKIMNDLQENSSVYFTPLAGSGPVPPNPPPPGPGPVFLPPPGPGPVFLPPPGPGPVFLPPPGPGPVFRPPFGPGPVFLPPPGPGPILLPPPGPGPILLPPPGPGRVLRPPPMFGVGHDGWRNPELPPVLHQQTGLMTGLNRSQPAQLYSEAGQCNCAPVSHFPSNIMSNMRPVGIFNGQPVYPLVPAAAELKIISKMNRKRKRQHENDYDQPRAKKHLNAFMLYQNEQRRNMTATNMVAMSKVLGDRWNHLSKDQQAEYFEQAQRQVKLHDQHHHLEPPLFDHSPLEAPSITDWSRSTHFDGQNFAFDNTDQLMSVFENELAEEKSSVPDSAPEALETPCLPDFTVVVTTAETVEPAVPTPSPLVWSPSTEVELQTYSSRDVDWLVSDFENELAAVIPCVLDSTVMSSSHSAEISCVSDWTAETLGSPLCSPPKSPFDDTDGLFDDIDLIFSYH